MPKEAVFTIKLEPELRDAFMADAAELDRPASQIMRELFKDYLRKREERKAPI
jgi:predicted transcriptional regulator